MKICRSKFDAWVSVYQFSYVSDGAGGRTRTDTLRDNIKVLIDERIASDPLDRDAKETQRRVAFYTSYRSDIVVSDRIQLDGINHKIVSLTRVGEDGKSAYRGKYLRIDTDSSTWYGL